MPVDITEKYYRYRIRSPKLFKQGTLRTLDIGDVGKHKLIRGILKSTGEYSTQAVLVERKYEKSLREETRKIIKQEKLN